MRSLKSIHRKAAKARARRKRYEKARNRNANVPHERWEEKEPTYRQVKIREGGPVIFRGGRPKLEHKAGRPKLEHKGYRTKVMKRPIFTNPDPADPNRPATDEYGRDIGMARYTRRRKVHQPKQRNITTAANNNK